MRCENIYYISDILVDMTNEWTMPATREQVRWRHHVLVIGVYVNITHKVVGPSIY